MPGLVPGIHVFGAATSRGWPGHQGVYARLRRAKPDHDEAGTICYLNSMSTIEMIDVVSVKPLGGYRLRIAFSDGLVGVHDLSSTVARDGEMVRPLKDPAFFARVFVELGALTWPNGFDLDPIALHDRMAEAGELTPVAAE